MSVTVAKTAGFCFGVRRAVELAEQQAKENGTIWAYGEIIHNMHEIRRMQYSLFEVAEPGTKIYLGLEGSRPGDPNIEWPWHGGMLQDMYLSGPRSKVW